MSRDHRTLRVFAIADRLVIDIYQATKQFPTAERYGLQAQIRRAAVSIATNIVEGCARRSTREYLNFFNIARASGAEVAYLVQLTYALEILSKSSFAILDELCQQLVPQLEALVDSVEQLWIEERKAKRVKTARNRGRARNARLERA